nr:hypothetical protein [Desulfovibrio sp.]
MIQILKAIGFHLKSLSVSVLLVCCLLLAMPAWAYNFSGYLTGTTTNMQFRLTNEGFYVGNYFTRDYLEPP